jgi:hypothetical protein
MTTMDNAEFISKLVGEAMQEIKLKLGPLAETTAVAIIAETYEHTSLATNLNGPEDAIALLKHTLLVISDARPELNIDIPPITFGKGGDA